MYHHAIKAVEDDIKEWLKKVNELIGLKESDTGLAPPSHWDLAADRQAIRSKSSLFHPSRFKTYYFLLMC